MRKRRTREEEKWGNISGIGMWWMQLRRLASETLARICVCACAKNMQREVKRGRYL